MHNPRIKTRPATALLLASALATLAPFPAAAQPAPAAPRVDASLVEHADPAATRVLLIHVDPRDFPVAAIPFLMQTDTIAGEAIREAFGDDAPHARVHAEVQGGVDGGVAAVALRLTTDLPDADERAAAALASVAQRIDTLFSDLFARRAQHIQQRSDALAAQAEAITREQHELMQHLADHEAELESVDRDAVLRLRETESEAAALEARQAALVDALAQAEERGDLHRRAGQIELDTVATELDESQAQLEALRQGLGEDHPRVREMRLQLSALVAQRDTLALRLEAMSNDDSDALRRELQELSIARRSLQANRDARIADVERAEEARDTRRDAQRLRISLDALQRQRDRLDAELAEARSGLAGLQAPSVRVID